MEKIHTELKKVLESKVFIKVLYTAGIILIAMAIFSAGISVGFHKASFGRAWGDNYYNNFGMGHKNEIGKGFKKMGMMDYFPNAHGAVGKIIKIELPTIIVSDKDNTEKVVLIKDDTKIQRMREENLTTKDLTVDSFIVVIGSPNDKGQIEAKLIRIMPMDIPSPVPTSAPILKK